MQWRGTDGSVAHNYNYNTFFHNFGTGTESANAWTFYLQRINEMTKAMETPTSFEAEDVRILVKMSYSAGRPVGFVVGDYLRSSPTGRLLNFQYYMYTLNHIMMMFQLNCTFQNIVIMLQEVN